MDGSGPRHTYATAGLTHTNRADHGQSPRKRKKRMPLNCSECRRLKSKCDREDPCGSCVRRGKPESCSGVPASTGDEQEAPRRPKQVTIVAPSDRPVRSVMMASGSGSAPAAAQPVLASSNTGNTGNTGHTLNTHVPLNTFVMPPPPSAGLSLSMPRPAPSSSSPSTTASQQQPHSSGTLRLDRGGRSRYLGPTAALRWLRDQESNDETHIPSLSQPASPRTTSQALPISDRGAAFPFDDAFVPMTKEAIIGKLPSRNEAMNLTESYYRYYAWHFDIAPRTTVIPILEHLYPPTGIHGPIQERRIRLHPQELALVFIIFAMGARHNLEWNLGEGPEEEYLALAKTCLARGAFLTHHTIAAVQTLHIMASYTLETDEGRSVDTAWPLFGLAMRLGISMGLHRDGSEWSLPTDVVEQRRRVFWECYSQDVFQANCSSRPNAIYASYYDARIPSERYIEDNVRPGNESYHTFKFRLSQHCASIIDLMVRADLPEYSQVAALHEKMTSFQTTVSFPLQCRAMLEALPSMYPDPEEARKCSPAPHKQDLSFTMQQFSLAMNISEMILYLHRPFFARILEDPSTDPVRAPYCLSYLTVVERCNVIIQVVSGIFALYPVVSARHWVFWYHLFNAAVCMGSLVLQRPLDALASLAIGQIDTVIRLFSQVVHIRTSPTTKQNMMWLLQLREDITSSQNAALSGSVPERATPSDHGEPMNGHLVSLKTRLIERASRDEPLSLLEKPISSVPMTSDMPFLPFQGINPFEDQPVGGLGDLDKFNPSVDELLHQLCNYPNPASMAPPAPDMTEDMWEWDMTSAWTNGGF